MLFCGALWFLPRFQPSKPGPKVQNYYFHILYRKEYYLKSPRNCNKTEIDFCEGWHLLLRRVTNVTKQRLKDLERKPTEYFFTIFCSLELNITRKLWSQKPKKRATTPQKIENFEFWKSIFCNRNYVTNPVSPSDFRQFTISFAIVKKKENLNYFRT